MKTNKQRMVSILSICLALMLAACEREGPMGPEGPQGPDGPPGEDASGGGEGGSSVISLMSDPEAGAWWEISDGWGGYGVYELKGGSVDIPENLKEDIEKGMAVVYLRGIEGAWYKLPFTREAAKDQIYEATFYGTDLNIVAKSKNNTDGEERKPLQMSQVKVVIAKPTNTYTLNLNN